MDNTSTPARLHPLMVAAAISIIIFCGVGVAALTGILPMAKSQDAPAIAANTAGDEKTATPPEAAPAIPEVTKVEPRPAVAEPGIVRPHRVRVVEKQAAAPVCYNCGTVVAVTPVSIQGDASGVGAVGGAVVGGVVGHQFGKGHGKQAMTALGAIGGALAGNEVEKTQRRSMRYDVTVRMEDGSSRTVSYAAIPPLSSGDRVRVEGDSLVRY